MGVDILARAMASGKGSGVSALGLKVDSATDEISLTNRGEPIADSGATLPKYGLDYNTATGGLTLTKNGQGVQGETVALPPYGSPLKADTIAQMTDTDKVYVLTTDGHWYYYDGTVWTDGGVYNAVSVVTDKTLTVEDVPADAKATGEAVEELKTQITEESIKTQEKTYGLSSDALLYMNEIPDYYTVASANPTTYNEASAYIEDKIASIPDGKHFIFITDTHWQNNAKHSTQLINYVRKRTGIKKVIFGGDLTNYAGNKYLGKRIAGEYMYQTRRAFGKDLLPVVGDHDSNMAYNEMTAEQYPDYYVPYQQLVPIFMDDIKHIYHCADYSTKLLDYATGDDYAELVAFFKSVYYVDDISDKIRYIVLNCGASAPKYGSIYNVFGITPNIEVLRLQYDWLYDTLMSTPEGYDVAVCSHKIAFTSTPGNIALGMIRAFKDKTPMTQSTYTAGNEKMEAWWPHNKGYNFAGAPTVGKVFTVNGHIHYDMISYSKLGSDNKWNYHTAYNGEVLNQATSAEIPSIFTTTDSVGRWQDAPAADRVPMELGTVTEQAFDVYTIVDDGIVLTRFGAGNDRRIYINT